MQQLCNSFDALLNLFLRPVFRMPNGRKKTFNGELSIKEKIGICPKPFQFLVRREIPGKMPISDVVTFGCYKPLDHWIHCQVTEIGSQLRMFCHVDLIADRPKIAAGQRAGILAGNNSVPVNKNDHMKTS